MSAKAEAGGLEQVAVALDTNDRATFERWCALFGPRVGVLKVGLEAFVRWGPPAIETARRHARGLFLDLKLHDIPNTVAGAVRSAREFEVDYLTIHAAGGPAMIAAAAEAAEGKVALLAVTVLTHKDGTITTIDNSNCARYCQTCFGGVGCCNNRPRVVVIKCQSLLVGT